MINHIVFFKLAKPEPEMMQKGKEILMSMEGRVPMLRHLTVGVDMLHSERSYDIVLLTGFDSLDDLEAYQVDPYHNGKVRDFIKENVVSSVVVDYES
ncbi:MAG: Dabb family protein [Desulfuromonadales bacterium]|nr:Dabb family protein [Desulfuromonadales bacterium]